jgi:hypothetical protein
VDTTTPNHWHPQLLNTVLFFICLFGCEYKQKVHARISKTRGGGCMRLKSEDRRGNALTASRMDVFCGNCSNWDLRVYYLVFVASQLTLVTIV